MHSVSECVKEATVRRECFLGFQCDFHLYYILPPINTLAMGVGNNANTFASAVPLVLGEGFRRHSLGPKHCIQHP